MISKMFLLSLKSSKITYFPGHCKYRHFKLLYCSFKDIHWNLNAIAMYNNLINQKNKRKGSSESLLFVPLHSALKKEMNIFFISSYL